MERKKTGEVDKVAAKLSEEKKSEILLKFLKRNVNDKNHSELTTEDKEDFKTLLEDVRSKAAEIRDILVKNK